ncbi:MAG: TIM barrel protein, partial [Armatimonadetes bacterium]|nr:TIM barrel protein [Armatimonadota bacterium]
MPDRFDRYNDGTGNLPRLRVQQSLWGMTKLPMNAPEEWSVEEKLRRCKEAGFEAVECWISDENEKQLVPALGAAGLRLVMGHRPFSLDDVRSVVDRAVRLKSDYVFMQPASAFHSLEEIVALVREGRRYANDHGVTMFVETHRNNFTENLPQTLALIERVPDIRFTADLSHFIVVGEFYGWPEERVPERLAPVLERTSHIHGRIGNGEQVQVDVGDGSGQTPQFFVEMWSIALRHWLKEAGPGDVFPFTSELGPPRYAITLP